MKKIFLSILLCQMLLSAQDIWSSGKGPAIVPIGMSESAMPVRDGAIVLPSGKYFYTRNIPARLSCSQFKVLELEMRASTPAEVFTGIYWRTVEEPKFSEERKAVITVPLNPQWKKVLLPLDAGNWQGNMLDFRLDFRVPAGVKTELRTIRFLKELPKENFTAPLKIFPGSIVKGYTLSNFKLQADKFSFTMPKSYGYTHIVPVHYAATQGRYLKVTFKAEGASSVRIATYFRTAAEANLTDSKSIWKQVKNSGNTQSVILDLGSKESYKGLITGFRFDFGAVAGANFEVTGIEIVNDPTESLPLAWERGTDFSKSNFLTSLASGRIYIVRPVTPDTVVKYFDELGNQVDEEKLTDGTFSLFGKRIMAQIVAKGNVPAPELIDSGNVFTLWKSFWIAPQDKVRQGGRFIYRKEVELASPASGRIRLTADDGFILKINGKTAAERTGDWRKIMDVDCTGLLKSGKNILEVEVINAGDWGGLLLQAGFVDANDKKIAVNSDKSWKISDNAGQSYAAVEIGMPPVGPWGKMPYADIFDPVSIEKDNSSKPHSALPVPKIKVKNTANGVRIIYNGQPLYLCGFKTSYNAPEQHQMMTANGIAVFHASSSKMIYHGSYDFARQERGKLDFSILEDNIKSVLASNPEARLMISIGLDAPEWFIQENPGEMTTIYGGINTKLSSPASEKLKKENVNFLKAMITHLEKSPYAGNIAVYRTVSQCDGGEYQYYTTWRQDFDGYSQAMLKRFREFLLKKYGSDAALAEAWGKNVTVASAEIPLPEERSRSTYDTFRDPSKDRQVLDFIDCQSEVMVDWAIYHNKIMRELVPDKLIASYGGYTMFYLQPQMEKSGHLAFFKLLDSGLVNLYTPPQDYNMRSIGSPGGSMVPHGSVRLRGQKLFSENDSRTHFGGVNGHCHSDSIFEDIGLLKRDFAFNLTTDSSSYFYDMTGSWFNDLQLLRVIGECSRIGRAALQFNTATDSKIAIFTDVASFKLISPKAVGFSGTVLREVRRELNSAGAGIADEYYLNDILRDDFPADRYKVAVFPNIFNPSKEIRQAIENKFKKHGCTLVFGYGAGMFHNDKLDAQGMKKLTGMDFSIDPSQKANVNGMQLAPAIFPVQEKILKTGNFTVIYLPNVAINRLKWNKLLTDTGIHCCTDSGDPVAFNGRFLSIHAATQGTKSLKLPAKSNVYDLFRKKCVAENVAEFTVPMMRGETNIYFLGTQEEYNKFSEVR